MAIFMNNGNRKVEKARRVLDNGGYTVIKNDGTVIPAPPEKKPFPKKQVAVAAGVGAAALAGLGLGLRHLFGGAAVSPETVEAVSEAIGDVAAEVEADEAIETLGDVAEDVIDTSMVL